MGEDKLRGEAHASNSSGMGVVLGRGMNTGCDMMHMRGEHICREKVNHQGRAEMESRRRWGGGIAGVSCEAEVGLSA